MNCKKLKKIKFFGTKITSFPRRCFFGCGFETFEVPTHITSLGEGCFENNVNLKKI